MCLLTANVNTGTCLQTGQPVDVSYPRKDMLPFWSILEAKYMWHLWNVMHKKYNHKDSDCVCMELSICITSLYPSFDHVRRRVLTLTALDYFCLKVRRSCCCRHVHFADRSLGWGRACSGSWQVSRVRCPHATISVFFWGSAGKKQKKPISQNNVYMHKNHTHYIL